jgi:hypothetical protein
MKRPTEIKYNTGQFSFIDCYDKVNVAYNIQDAIELQLRAFESYSVELEREIVRLKEKLDE